jgi:hypothetical protein
MSTSTQARIEQMIEREDRELREGLDRSLNRGGMPAEAEFLEVEAKLGAAFNTLEDLTIRLRGIADFAGKGKDSPSLPAVTSEHVGLVAGFARSLDVDLAQLRQEVDVVEAAVYDLETIRRERGDA